MFSFIYYTKKGKFKTNVSNEIPWDDLHSPDENTPAFENNLNGYKSWWYEGRYHRLLGPAEIWKEIDNKFFYLNGIEYEFKVWIKLHPNQEVSFQTMMKLKYS